jgi:alkanesulfonate monooxygenase SsuD/methylene tetrahydromethanopterin reductase-like flavin-dependent oxidoreductase (luciferase family)
MRIGVLLLPTDPWPAAVARVQELERLGYHSVWTYDHLTWRHYRDRPWFGAVPWLAGMAAATRRVAIGTMVASPNFRHPVPFAKEAVTLDHISDGRLVLGIGAGGTGFDATVLGAPEPLSPRQRADRLTEFVDLLDLLLRNPATSFDGDWYQAHDAVMHPPSVQQPRIPLAIAATGPRTLKLAARHGDMWITHSPEPDARRQADILERECEAIGRDPAAIKRVYLIGNTDERPLQSLDAFADFAGRFATRGFSELVFHHPRPDDPKWNEPPEIVEQLAAEYLSG